MTPRLAAFRTSAAALAPHATHPWLARHRFAVLDHESVPPPKRPTDPPPASAEPAIKGTAYLVVEWIGRWSLPDSDHGGAHPGPYATRQDAANAIRAAVQWEARGEDRKRAKARHAIVPVEWPAHAPVMPERMKRRITEV